MTNILTPYAELFLGYSSKEDELYTCSTCRQESIPDIFPTLRHIIDGKDVCQDCAPRCEECCEYIDDNSPAPLGPVVRYRRWELDGKLSDPAHGMCGASLLISVLSGDYHFDAADATKEQIDTALGYPNHLERTA